MSGLRRFTSAAEDCVRWALIGPEVAVDLLVVPRKRNGPVTLEAARVATHSTFAPHDIAARRHDGCDLLGQDYCWFDAGYGDARGIWNAFCEHGEDALWAALQDYYDSFWDGLAQRLPTGVAA